MYDSMSKRLKGKTRGFAPCTGGGVNYDDGRRPGSLGITVAVKQRQLQKQKLPSQPQPPTQTIVGRWTGLSDSSFRTSFVTCPEGCPAESRNGHVRHAWPLLSWYLCPKRLVCLLLLRKQPVKTTADRSHSIELARICSGYRIGPGHPPYGSRTAAFLHFYAPQHVRARRCAGASFIIALLPLTCSVRCT